MTNISMDSMKFIVLGFENHTWTKIPLSEVKDISLEGITKDLYYSPIGFKERLNVKDLYVVFERNAVDVDGKDFTDRLYDYSDVCFIYFMSEDSLSASEVYYTSWDSVHNTSDNINQLSGYSLYSGDFHLIIGTDKVNKEVFYLNGCEESSNKKSNDFINAIFPEEQDLKEMSDYYEA